jgi:hypothetical protein
MLHAILVMRKSLLSVEWRIYYCAFYLAFMSLLQGLKRKKVVAMDQYIIKDIFIAYTLFRMVGKLRIFQQNPWLQARSIVLADPGEFKSGVLRCHGRVQ